MGFGRWFFAFCFGKFGFAFFKEPRGRFAEKRIDAPFWIFVFLDRHSRTFLDVYETGTDSVFRLAFLAFVFCGWFRMVDIQNNLVLEKENAEN